MILESDFVRNLRVLEVLHKPGMFPLRISTNSDVPCETPDVTGGRRRKWSCWLGFSFAFMHSLYVKERLVQYIFSKGLAPTYELALSANIATASTFCCWWFWIYFVRSPNIVSRMVNMLSVNSGGLESGNSRLAMYTRQDWVATLMAVIGATAVVGICMLYCLDPFMKFLISAAINCGTWSPWLFPLFLLAEVYVLTWYVVHGLFPIYTHVLFMDVAIKLLSNKKQKALRSNYGRMHFIRGYKDIRELQLWIIHFNDINSSGLFMFKLYCIAIGTMWGFFAVKDTGSSLFSVVAVALFVDIVILYSVLYEKAFGIPTECAGAKKEMLVRINAVCLDGKFKKYARRCMKSVPSMGIKIGSFHTFERESTPIFIDFIVRNVVGLLVMY